MANLQHKLKERKSKLCEVVATLRTRRRYGLTGTAIQNNYDELFTLVDSLTPGCMGVRKDFVRVPRGSAPVIP